tara:strand:- start:1303 stop:1626 length:324 start_codon:yes stop_codon:yes gene_type:complete
MSNYANRKWVIMTLADIDAGDITEEQVVIDEETGEETTEQVVVGNTFIDAAIESSKATLRLSVDGTKTILKWDNETPEPFEGMDTYTHAEILAELAGPDWTSQVDTP